MYFLIRFYAGLSVVGITVHLGSIRWGRAFSFLNRLYWFGVVMLCTLGLNWGVHLHWVCTYFSIGSTGLVK